MYPLPSQLSETCSKQARVYPSCQGREYIFIGPSIVDIVLESTNCRLLRFRFCSNAIRCYGLKVVHITLSTQRVIRSYYIQARSRRPLPFKSDSRLSSSCQTEMNVTIGPN
jgi:hypothetical protein